MGLRDDQGHGSDGRAQGHQVVASAGPPFHDPNGEADSGQDDRGDAGGAHGMRRVRHIAVRMILAAGDAAVRRGEAARTCIS